MGRGPKPVKVNISGAPALRGGSSLPLVPDPANPESFVRDKLSRMTEEEQALYVFRQNTLIDLGYLTGKDRDFGVFVSGPDAEEDLLEEYPLIVKNKDKDGYDDYREEKFWEVSLPGGYKMSIKLEELPKGPLEFGHVLVTPLDMSSIKDDLSSVIYDSLRFMSYYNDPDHNLYNYDGARKKAEALAPLIAHCFGCSVEEARAEIDRVEKEYLALGIPKEEELRREHCEEQFSSYSAAIDVYDEELVDGIVSEYANTSEEAFARYVMGNGIRGAIVGSDYIGSEIAKYRRGEYGDYEGVSDEEIVLEIIREDSTYFEESRREWKEEVGDKVFEDLVARDDFLEVLQNHGVDQAQPYEEDVDSLARQEMDFADFFAENSKFSPENISYGPRALARDMGVVIDEDAEESADFVVKDGKMTALPPLED